MSDWAPKRFWEKVEVDVSDLGYAVRLDGRGVKTPAKAPLIVPTRDLAEAIAEEWRAQVDRVDPNSMPFTRMANSALDKVRPQRAEIASMLADYGDSDLLCYRAQQPAELVLRQAERWDPVLDWCAAEMGARLTPRAGVMHAPQAPESLQKLAAEVHKLKPFSLAAFHDLVAVSGSLVLGFAVIRAHLSAEDAWTLSRLDEDWQIEQWGHDEEADAVAEKKRLDFVLAARFFHASGAE